MAVHLNKSPLYMNELRDELAKAAPDQVPLSALPCLSVAPIQESLRLNYVITTRLPQASSNRVIVRVRKIR